MAVKLLILNRIYLALRVCVCVGGGYTRLVAESEYGWVLE